MSFGLAAMSTASLAVWACWRYVLYVLGRYEVQAAASQAQKCLTRALLSSHVGHAGAFRPAVGCFPECGLAPFGLENPAETRRSPTTGPIVGPIETARNSIETARHTPLGWIWVQVIDLLIQQHVRELADVRERDLEVVPVVHERSQAISQGTFRCVFATRSCRNGLKASPKQFV